MLLLSSISQVGIYPELGYYIPDMKKTIHNSEYGKLISLLIELRKNEGITQTDLASRLKKPQSFVSKYETGERRIDVIEFLEISKAIKADPIKIIQSLNSK